MARRSGKILEKYSRPSTVLYFGSENVVNDPNSVRRKERTAFLLGLDCIGSGITEIRASLTDLLEISLQCKRT
jgi:hypothetical protein